MQYDLVIEGISALIMHSGAGIDPEHPIKQEIAKLVSKKGSIRTATENERIRDLEVMLSLWTHDNKPTIPPAAIRSCIETGARKLKEGPAVREGMIVLDSTFTYDTDRYGATLEEVSKSARFTVPVRVGQSRTMRTRAMFEIPWSVAFSIDADDDLVEKSRLSTWLDIAGRRIGLGDWRPEKSGSYGRFKTRSIEAR